MESEISTVVKRRNIYSKGKRMRCLDRLEILHADLSGWCIPLAADAQNYNFLKKSVADLVKEGIPNANETPTDTPVKLNESQDLLWILTTAESRLTCPKKMISQATNQRCPVTEITILWRMNEAGRDWKVRVNLSGWIACWRVLWLWSWGTIAGWWLAVHGCLTGYR